MPSIDFPEVQQIGGDENWMTQIVGYLKEGKLPQGKNKAMVGAATVAAKAMTRMVVTLLFSV